MQEFDPRRPTLRYAPRLFVGLGGICALALGWKLTAAEATAPAPPPLDAAAIAALQHEAFAQAEAQPGFSRPESVAVEVRPGDTLEAAVARTGVSPEDARQAVRTLAEAMDTVNIKAGMTFDAAIAKPKTADGETRLVGLSLRTGPATAVTLSRTFDGALRLREMEEAIRNETMVAQGEIQGSLYESAAKLGANSAVTSQVVKLFAHKLDFQRDIKAGDEFKLVFERKVTESGRVVETGAVDYAEVKGVRFYRFVRNDGSVDFFDAEGKNVRGFLLRTPVDGARITSTFGTRRHPVLGYTRAHQGVDFGAGHGTPILSAGDGVIVEAKRWGGYGNWVRVRHSNGWETGYAHASRFANGIRPGVRVKQGQVIAYVGSTGMSTGPHLHYEVWRNGQRVNPIGAKVPQGTILAGAELAAFKARKAHIDNLLTAQAQAAAPAKLAALDTDRALADLRR
ncbi:peptidoglycan DD-metalloendopeptidase family protein [Phenylobacterium sp.]|uniref:peptidoglycan DD-metalloendopeptidase family protein n=1 Tax=Phenylobacterium sp. TaxID=1871053 RepID=UPI002FD8B103